MNARWFDRVINGGAWKQIRFLLIIVVVAVGLFSVGVYWGGEHGMMSRGVMEEECGDTVSFGHVLWNVYNNFIDTGNQQEVNGADRGWAFLISLIGSVVVGGLLISTISNIIERRVENCSKGLVRYRLADHVVIIGADAMLPGLVRQLCERDKRGTIAVQTSRDVDQVRMKLFSKLSKGEERRIVFNYARRDAKDELDSLCVTKAREVFILGDSGELDEVEYYHDSMNVDCLNLVGQLCREQGRSTPLPCRVFFEDRSTFAVFQFSDLASEIKPYIDFQALNFYEIWARKVLVDNRSTLRVQGKPSNENAERRVVDYRPLDYEPLTYESEKYVHLVIVGMSRMGVALAVEAAHVAHYPNFLRDKKKKTRITFIDSHAEREMETFKQAYSALFEVSYSSFRDARTRRFEEWLPKNEYRHLGEDFIDIEWHFVEGEIESEGVRRMIGEWCADDCALMTVAICLNLTRQSIAASMYLPECVRERGIPVLVQQRITSGIIENLAGGFAKDTDKMLRFSDLRPFGMLNDCLELDASPDVKARRVHYVYSTYDVGKGCLPQPCPSDEEVDALWEELKKERVVKQWSNIYCADSIAGKLRSVGHGREEWDSLTILAEREVDLLAQVEHNRWNVEELLLGYRPVTLKEQAWVEEDYKRRKKEMRDRKFVHYDIRDYSLLREESRAYDAAIVRCIPFVLHGRM